MNKNPNTRFKLTLTRALSFLLALALVAGTNGCVALYWWQTSGQEPVSAAQEPTPALTERTHEVAGTYKNLSFDELCEEFFVHEVSLDNLSLNQLAADPSALKIAVPRPATLGNYSYESTMEDNDFYAELLEAFKHPKNFTVEQLSAQQQLSYAVVTETLEAELKYENFYYYFEPLVPSNGAQANLPLSLLDFSFRTAEDIEIYLELLADVPRYFDQLIEIERAKKELGLLMSSVAMDDTLAEARAYVGAVDTHVLVKAFNEMLDEAKDMQAAGYSSVAALAALGPTELAALKERNRQAVANSVIPAYETLIKELELLRSSCKEGTRLYDYPNGRAYYEMRMRTHGFAQSPTEASALLDTMLSEYVDTIIRYSGDSSLGLLIPETTISSIGEDPRVLLAFVQEHAAAEFPDAGDLKPYIKIAPEDSPNDYAMAYFMIPPVDEPLVNIITYFPRNISDKVEFYTTMAHEGYPGHMYQVYEYSLQQPSHLEKYLSSTAYMEGWAMYAELRAMRYLNVDEAAKEAYAAYIKFMYGLQARIDLGVNYEGWNLAQTKAYLANYGLDSSASDLYDTAIEQALAYLPYGLGVIEFEQLRAKAESRQGSNFNALAFHEQLLRNGPLPFDLLESEFDAWLKK